MPRGEGQRGQSSQSSQSKGGVLRCSKRQRHQETLGTWQCTQRDNSRLSAIEPRIRTEAVMSDSIHANHHEKSRSAQANTSRNET